MRRVAVIGVGVTKFGKHDRTSGELFAEAAVDALEDTGKKIKKEVKRERLVERARADFGAWMDAHELRVHEPATRA